MELIVNQKVKRVFDNYPKDVEEKLLHLRELVISTAMEIEGLGKLEETLKWGEPSYLTKYGSTIRIDWKKKSPMIYGMYFKCTSKLVPTFKLLYQDKFAYENSRAILFNLNDDLAEKELKQCISLALRYHKVKQLPLLGAQVY